MLANTEVKALLTTPAALRSVIGEANYLRSPFFNIIGRALYTTQCGHDYVPKQ